MSKKHTLKAIHNGKVGDKKGWIGLIEDEAMYQKLKSGELEWPEHVEKKMTHVKIPLELFLRFAALDLFVDELNEAKDKQTREELGV